jgi:hypothetical protein
MAPVSSSGRHDDVDLPRLFGVSAGRYAIEPIRIIPHALLCVCPRGDHRPRTRSRAARRISGGCCASWAKRRTWISHPSSWDPASSRSTARPPCHSGACPSAARTGRGERRIGRDGSSLYPERINSGAGVSCAASVQTQHLASVSTRTDSPTRPSHTGSATRSRRWLSQW